MLYFHCFFYTFLVAEQDECPRSLPQSPIGSSFLRFFNLCVMSHGGQECFLKKVGDNAQCHTSCKTDLSPNYHVSKHTIRGIRCGYGSGVESGRVLCFFRTGSAGKNLWKTGPGFVIFGSSRQGCGSESWKRSFYCGSGSAKILPLPHRLFDLKSNLAKKLCPFPDVD